MNYIPLLFAAALVLCTVHAENTGPVDPDAKVDLVTLIAEKGYPVERHYPVTEDGYILGMYRVPHGRNNGGAGLRGATRPVVLLQHGLLDSGSTWWQNNQYESFGFLLADAGYDVWVGNSRGNTYSTNHTTLSVDSQEYWDFSWDQMAKYDLPAQVNYALNVSGASSLSYVGHSQGTVQAFASFASQDLTDKVNLFIALAPVAQVKHVTNPVLQLLAHLKAADLLKLLGSKKFLPSSELARKLLPVLCKTTPVLCENFLFLIMGFDEKSMNATRESVYVHFAPSGTSVRNMQHWSQMVAKGGFPMFDFGSASENQKHYGQDTPPDYDLGKIEIPTALFSGGQDWLADPKDVAYLRDHLKASVVVDDVTTERYNHLDYVWGIDANVVVYERAMQLMNQYSQHTS